MLLADEPPVKSDCLYLGSVVSLPGVSKRSYSDLTCTYALSDMAASTRAIYSNMAASTEQCIQKLTKPCDFLLGQIWAQIHEAEVPNLRAVNQPLRLLPCHFESSANEKADQSKIKGFLLEVSLGLFTTGLLQAYPVFMNMVADEPAATFQEWLGKYLDT